MMFLLNNNWYLPIVIHMFGCRTIFRLENCVIMVVDVVVTMNMEIFRCSKVIVLMCVFLSPVKNVAITTAEDVCVFFGFSLSC